MSLEVDIEKRFSDFTLDVSFKAGDETLGFLGASGCGKSLTLRCIAGIETPDAGRIVVNGTVFFDRAAGSKPKVNLKPQERKTALLFQNYMLFPNLTVADNVGAGIGRDVPKGERDERVAAELKRFGLEGFGKRYPAQLSGGQQQRVALARALILKPKVLLFDEPLSNLDANLRRSMRDKIRELQKQFDITSLYVTHDQSEAFAVSDTVLVMNKGHIMQIGSPQDLYRQPASRFMASFMGDANLFPATFSDGYVDIYGYHLPRPLHFGTQGEGMVGVRPEAITLSDRGEESQRCVIRHVAYMGPQYEVTVEWHGQEILLQVNATRLQPDVGEQYYLEIHPYGMFVLADAA